MWVGSVLWMEMAGGSIVVGDKGSEAGQSRL